MYVKPLKRLWQKQFTKKRIKIRYIEEEMSTMSLNVSIQNVSAIDTEPALTDQQPNGSAILPEACSRQLWEHTYISTCENIHTHKHTEAIAI